MHACAGYSAGSRTAAPASHSAAAALAAPAAMAHDQAIACPANFCGAAWYCSCPYVHRLEAKGACNLEGHWQSPLLVACHCGLGSGLKRAELIEVQSDMWQETLPQQVFAYSKMVDAEGSRCNRPPVLFCHMTSDSACSLLHVTFSFPMDLLKSSSMGSCRTAGLRDFFFAQVQRDGVQPTL